MTPFGRARRARGVEHLRHGVGSDPCVRVVDSGGRRRRLQFPPIERLERLWRRAGDDQIAVGDVRQRTLEQCAVVREDHAGRERRPQRPERRVFAGEQRIGRRNRRIGNTDVHRRERQQAMLNAVAGENHERPVRRDAAVEQRLRQRADARQGIGVGQPTPVSGGVARRQKRSIGSLARPMLEPLGHLRRIRPEHVRRPRQNCAVGSLLDDRVGAKNVHPRLRSRARNVPPDFASDVSSGAGVHRSPNCAWKAATRS